MKRVAVIAIHGVADQKPGSSARSIADLLVGSKIGERDDDGKIPNPVQYKPFEERNLRIGLKPVRLADLVNIEEAEVGRLDQQSATTHYVQKGESPQLHFDDNKFSAKQPAFQHYSVEDMDHDYTREQLQHYTPETRDLAYETLMLEGQREHQNESHGVDVFEMYWADLSRLKSGFLSLFFEFYLLLFFLSRAGGITLERARHQFDNDERWAKLNKLHGYSETLLTLVVPILNLCILTLFVAAIPYYLPSDVDTRNLIYQLVPGIALALTIAVITYTVRLKTQSYVWPWVIVFSVAGLGVGLAAGWLVPTGERTALFVFWAMAAVLVTLLCKSYDRRRNGAFLIAGPLLIATGVIFAWHIGTIGTPQATQAASSAEAAVTAAQASINTSRELILALQMVWSCLIGLILLESVLGHLAQKSAPRSAKSIASRSVWTAIFSLVFPASLMLILNIALWLLLFKAFEHSASPTDADLKAIEAALKANVITGLWVSFAVLGGATLFAVWGIIPAIAAEIRNERNTDDRASWLGRSLSSAFRAMRLSGELFKWNVIALIPCLFILQLLWGPGDKELDILVISTAGVLIFLMLAGAHGPFSFLALGFRSGLDIALDVVNWLRVLPRNRTPKATICGRYASLLRHIATRKNEDGEPVYGSVVIIAHSQGTVITSDLLRFFKREYKGPQIPDPDLKRLYIDEQSPLKLYLFTMGSPLRQLYNLRFPIQYGWAGGPNDQPSPAALNLEQWSNAYCSGDYVGRYLWYTDASENADTSTIWKNEWKEHDEKRREICVGTGAHTHYWDGSRPEVVAELDRLIALAHKSGLINDH